MYKAIVLLRLEPGGGEEGEVAQDRLFRHCMMDGGSVMAASERCTIVGRRAQRTVFRHSGSKSEGLTTCAWRHRR